MMSGKRSHDFSPSGSKKRKHVALTVLQKVEMLKKLDEGATPKFVADTYNIAIRTVYDIRKNKTKILDFYAKSDTNAGIQNRKSLHQAKSKDLDSIVYEWFRQRRADGVPISGPLLRARAKQFHQELKIQEVCDFSSGWLKCFKKRHGIKYLKASGEKLSADKEAAEEFVDDFTQKVIDDNLTPDQIFNMDETGLFWRCLPRKTFVCNDETAPSGWKEAKERITVMLCSNAAGTLKCKPLVVGKSAKPRSFPVPAKSSFNAFKEFPVIYKNNQNSWVTKEIIVDWFYNHFALEARKHCNAIGLASDCKILLLMDNCGAHPSADALQSGNVMVQFLPPNTTSLIQPMDQGVIRSFKTHYKSEFLKNILNLDPSFKLPDYKKHFNLMDCVNLVAESWKYVSQSTLVNAWHNVWPSSLFIDCENDAMEFSGFQADLAKEKANELLSFAKEVSKNDQIFEEKEIVEWMTSSDEVTDEYLVTDSEIVESVLNPTCNNCDDDEDEEDFDTSKKIPFDEGLQLGEKYLIFLKTQNCVTQQELMTLYNLQKKLLLEKSKVFKQATIEQMFNKLKK